MADVAQIITKLKLDGSQFKGNVQTMVKSVQKLSAAGAAVTVAIGAAAVTTARFQDDMIKASRVAGTTAEKMSGISLAAEQTGIDMDTMRDALAKFQEAGPQEQLQKFGIAVSDAGGNARDSVDIFKDFSDRIKSLKTNAEKARASMAVFGGEGARLASTFNLGKEGLEKFSKKAKEFGIVVSEQAGKSAEKFNDNLNDLKNSIKGSKDALGSSVVEMVNASGAVTDLTTKVIEMRNWFENLDDSTKENIVQIASFTGGALALITALTAIVAIGPAVGAAFTALLGPLGLVIIGITALVAGAIAVKNAIDEAADATEKFAENKKIKDRANDLAEMVTFGKGILRNVEDINDETIKLIKTERFLTQEFKAQKQIAGQLLLIDKQRNIDAKFALLNESIASAAEIVNLTKRLRLRAEIGLQRAEERKKTKDIIAIQKQLVVLRGNEASALDRFLILIEKSKSLTKDTVIPLNEILTISKKIEVPKKKSKEATAAFRSELETLVNTFKKMKVGSENQIKRNKTLAESFIDGAKVVELFANNVSKVVAVFSDLSDIATASAERALEVLNRNFEVTARKLNEAQQKELDEFEKARDTKLASMQGAFDAEIEALRKTEDEKLFIIEQGANLRLLALNEEFQKEKELAEEKFQFFLDEQEKKFDAEKEAILRRAADEEQSKVNEQLLDEDFKQLTENLQAQHQENLSDLEKKFLDNSRDARDTADKAKEKNTTTTNKKIEDLEKQRDEALLEAQEAFADNFIKLQETQAEDQREIEKKNLEDNWKAQKQMYEQTKTIRKVEIGVSAAAAAAIVVAELAAAFPGVGIVAGAALATAILGVAAKRIDQIDELRPVKPAGLLTAGGVLRGPSHVGGGVPLEAEGGETVIDKLRTTAFLEKFDNMSQSRSIIINFEEGAIIMTGIEQDFTEDFLDNLGDSLAERMEREGVLSPLS